MLKLYKLNNWQHMNCQLNNNCIIRKLQKLVWDLMKVDERYVQL